MLRFGLKAPPRISYNQAMYRAVLTLLVGLMLSLSGGASALTFGKDGKQEMPDLIPDNLTPQELLDTVDANDKLLKIIEEGGMAGPLVYDYEWNRCSLISHNLELLFEKCPLSQKDRRVVVKAKRNKLLRKFQCGFEGFQRHMSNATPAWLFQKRAVNRCAERVKFTLDEYARLEKIIQRSGSEIVDSELKPKPLQPEAEVAAPNEPKEKKKKILLSDSQAPLLTIIRSGANGREGYLTGSVTDNVQVAEVLVDGAPVSVTANGSFEWTGFVPATGKNIIVEVFDTAALVSREVVRIERGQIAQAAGPTFDDLNPMAGRRVIENKDALALIVGISDYERTDAPAIYADKDAQYFHDYASLKLGIPDQNITTLVNDKAEHGDVLIAVKDWMRRSSKAGKSDVYIFFAGHGLASQDGEQMFLLPFDGRPRLLDETAILREKLFSDIADANPRSVTVFLDTCYSGATRGKDVLLASRPIAIRAKEQAVPEGFTVMTAAAGDQTAKPLEEAKHGMFSYFLMKGMEGDADANQDNQITAGELHAYVQQNVIQQSSGSQTPELQGDDDRVLVRFH